jgi:hypothetical protein
MARVNGHTADEVIQAIRDNNGLLAAAARALNVNRTTVYNYVKRYPTIARALEEARDTNLDFAEGQLMKAVKAGNVTAIMFLLKTVGKNRGYVERQEVTGPDGEPIKVKAFIGINPDDWDSDEPEIHE